MFFCWLIICFSVDDIQGNETRQSHLQNLQRYLCMYLYACIYTEVYKITIGSQKNRRQLETALFHSLLLLLFPHGWCVTTLWKVWRISDYWPRAKTRIPVQSVILTLILVWVWYGFRMIILNSTIWTISFPSCMVL